MFFFQVPTFRNSCCLFGNPNGSGRHFRRTNSWSWSRRLRRTSTWSGRRGRSWPRISTCLKLRWAGEKIPKIFFGCHETPLPPFCRGFRINFFICWPLENVPRVPDNSTLGLVELWYFGEQVQELHFGARNHVSWKLKPRLYRNL